jgi:exopolyphosphatase/guanosine-5'-triphosphate,3'-diphosphate pyrophosphatase
VGSGAEAVRSGGAVTKDPVAAIDIGTNTTLMLLARPRAGGDGGGEPEVLADLAEITRLGRGIGGDGRLSAEAIERTLAVLERYAAVAKNAGASIHAIGTEGLRRAPNAEEFLVPARRVLGTAVEVIDGDREAALTFRAVVESFPGELATERAMVIDIGGGSTEIIVADAGRVAFRRSLPLGSVRLHERHLRADPPAPAQVEALEREVAATLASAEAAFAQKPALLVGVAGTVTSLMAMSLGLDSYDPARVHGARLTAAELDRQLERLGRATQSEREHFAGLDPRRADVIFAGALLLRAIVRRSGAAAVRVSDRGIRWGLWYDVRQT